jgi:nucleotide-binding universal stress UspA family protein
MSEAATKYGMLVGVDGSAESDAAVSWAAREASMGHEPVTLMYVVQPVVVSWRSAPASQLSRNGKKRPRADRAISGAVSGLGRLGARADPPGVATGEFDSGPSACCLTS